MKTILVPTDFSKCANDAFQYAIGLAKTTGARIVVLHAWDIVYPLSEIPVPAQFIAKQQHDAQLSAVTRMKPLCYKAISAGVQCEQVNRQGAVIETILDTITKEHVSMIIMGTNGASGLKEVFAGTNTARVVRKATCPVIAIPPGTSFKGLRKITYATDYQQSDFSALKKLADIARQFGAEISLLHIAGEMLIAEGAREVLKLFTERVIQKVKYEQITFQLIHGRDVEQQLERYVQHKHTDLFVLSTMHRDLLDRLFGDSYARRLVYHTRIPLMVLHHMESSGVFF